VQGEIRSLTFVCSDVVGLDRLAEEFGDVHARGIWRSALDALRESIVVGARAIVKTSGDGLTAVYTDRATRSTRRMRFGGALRRSSCEPRSIAAVRGADRQWTLGLFRRYG